MRILNGDLLIKHIIDKKTAYSARRDAANEQNKLTEVADYNIRILPLDNLLKRILRGEFDAVQEVKDENKT